jgi:hypothetical protein
MAYRVVLPHDLYSVAPCDSPEQEAYQLQLVTSNVLQLDAQVEALSLATAPTKQSNSSNPTNDFNRPAGRRNDHDARPANSNDNPLEYIDPR